MESKFHPGISRILELGHVERPVTDERPFGRRDFNDIEVVIPSLDQQPRNFL